MLPLYPWVTQVTKNCDYYFNNINFGGLYLVQGSQRSDFYLGI